MEQSKAKDLFHLQTELVQMKVDMAVNRTIDRVVDQITSLRHEMHTEIGNLKNEMNNRFSSLDNRFASLDNRVTAIETKLGMINAKRKEWRDRLLDLFFKAGWALLSLVFAFLIIHVK